MVINKKILAKEILTFTAAVILISLGYLGISIYKNYYEDKKNKSIEYLEKLNHLNNIYQLYFKDSDTIEFVVNGGAGRYAIPADLQYSFLKDFPNAKLVPFSKLYINYLVGLDKLNRNIPEAITQSNKNSIIADSAIISDSIKVDNQNKRIQSSDDGKVHNELFLFMSEQSLTHKAELDFLNEYQNNEIFLKVYEFLLGNNLTDLEKNLFYNSYLIKMENGTFGNVQYKKRLISDSLNTSLKKTKVIEKHIQEYSIKSGTQTSVFIYYFASIILGILYIARPFAMIIRWAIKTLKSD